MALTGRASPALPSGSRGPSHSPACRGPVWVARGCLLPSRVAACAGLRVGPLQAPGARRAWPSSWKTPGRGDVCVSLEGARGLGARGQPPPQDACPTQTSWAVRAPRRGVCGPDALGAGLPEGGPRAWRWARPERGPWTAAGIPAMWARAWGLRPGLPAALLSLTHLRTRTCTHVGPSLARRPRSCRALGRACEAASQGPRLEAHPLPWAAPMGLCRDLTQPHGRGDSPLGLQALEGPRGAREMT